MRRPSVRGLTLKFILPGGLVVLAVTGLAAYFLVRDEQASMLDEARQQARLIDAQVRTTRLYLAETLQVDLPEATTVDMLKQMAEGGVHFVRFVSLDPVNPENAPRDSFERRGLEALMKTGAAAFEGIDVVEGRTLFRRLTPDLATSESCSECHTGVNKGDLIGALVVSIPVDAMLEASHSRAAVLGGSSVAAVALLVVMLAIILRSTVISPLNGRLVAALRAVAEGDLSREPASTANDEIGEAVRALGRASGNLRRLVQSVRDGARKVQASSRQLADSAGQVRLAVQQVAETANEMASGAERQSQAATSTAESARQLGDMVRRVTEATQQMALDAQHAARLAHEGRQALTVMGQRLDDIRGAVSGSGEAVSELGERSQRIGQIVDVITALAEQTNLLALNAAIEAARAGEQGRGFAVVAEEVRKLADQSRQAAAQIAGLVGEIRGQVERAVRMAQGGNQAVADSVSAISASGQTFEAIARAVEKTAGQIQVVGAAAEQMAAASGRVLQAVEAITTVAQQNAAGTEELASATEEQLAAVEEVAALSNQLAGMAAELLQAVEVFRL